MHKILYLIIFTCFICFNVNSQDIQSSTTGFSGYAAFSYSSWTSESFFLSDLAELEPNGLGIKIGIGYGITEKLSIHANHYGLSFNRNLEWNKFNISMQTLNARFSFGATLSKWRPNFEAGLVAVSNKVDPVLFDGFDDVELKNSGVGLHLGGGLNYYVNTNLTISAQASYKYGSFSDITISGTDYDPEENVDFAILLINLGVRYFID